MTKRLEHMVSIRLGNEAWKALEAQSKHLKEEVAGVARRLLTTELFKAEAYAEINKVIDRQGAELKDFRSELEKLLNVNSSLKHRQQILRFIKQKMFRLESHFRQLNATMLELSNNTMGALEALRDLVASVGTRQEKLAGVLQRLCEIIEELKHEVERVGA